MESEALIRRLEANQAVFAPLVDGVTNEQSRWRPQPGKWSLLEVVCHLLDEEREDFRQRLELTLADPSIAWPPIDPPGWVIERNYQERDFTISLVEFLAERERSLAWLRSLDAPTWDNSYAHPLLGPIRAGDILASWVAHDFLHIRQIVGSQFGWAAQVAEPYNPGYAGEWS
jgi:DinB superfamily